MDSIVSLDPAVMGGTPVFAGTRVPIQTLLDYIEGKRDLGRVSRGFSDRFER